MSERVTASPALLCGTENKTTRAVETDGYLLERGAAVEVLEQAQLFQMAVVLVVEQEADGESLVVQEVEEQVRTRSAGVFLTRTL